MDREEGEWKVETGVDSDSDEGDDEALDEVDVLREDFVCKDKVDSADNGSNPKDEPADCSKVAPFKDRLDRVGVGFIKPFGFG